MKEYTNGEVVVLWDPDKCTHSRRCIKGLPKVFDRDKRPWIDLKGASSEEITKVIDLCPSGALSYRRISGGAKKIESSAQIKTTRSGPLLIQGDCALTDEEGKILKDKGPYALCRCGNSKNKPYCDGTHTEIGFNDSQ